MDACLNTWPGTTALNSEQLHTSENLKLHWVQMTPESGGDPAPSSAPLLLSFLCFSLSVVAAASSVGYASHWRQAADWSLFLALKPGLVGSIIRYNGSKPVEMKLCWWVQSHRSKQGYPSSTNTLKVRGYQLTGLNMLSFYQATMLYIDFFRFSLMYNVKGMFMLLSHRDLTRGSYKALRYPGSVQ